MNFLSCPLGEEWIGASQPEGLAAVEASRFDHGAGSGLEEAVSPEALKQVARIHSLKLGQILWMGAKLPVYLAEWKIERAGRAVMSGVELVFPLDPWDLADAEAFCLSVREAGIGLIALPVAPVSPSAEMNESAERPGWKIPDETTLASRARALLEMQVAGMAEWGQETAPLTQIQWMGPEPSLAELRQYEERVQWAWAKKA